MLHADIDLLGMSESGLEDTKEQGKGMHEAAKDFGHSVTNDEKEQSPP